MHTYASPLLYKPICTSYPCTDHAGASDRERESKSQQKRVSEESRLLANAVVTTTPTNAHDELTTIEPADCMADVSITDSLAPTVVAPTVVMNVSLNVSLSR